MPGETTGTRFALRALHDGDAEAITDLFNQPRVIDGTMRIPFTAEAGVRDWLDNLGSRQRMIVADVDDRAVGFIRISQFDGRMSHCAEVFIAIHDDFHGQGIGPALMEAGIDMAENWMGVTRLQLEVLVDNPAVKLYERFGFQHEGRARAGTLRNGVLVDHYYMARLAPPIGRRPEDEEENP